MSRSQDGAWPELARADRPTTRRIDDAPAGYTARVPNTPDELWADADDAWQRRDVDGALRAADQALVLQPTHVAALNLAGYIRTTERADVPGEFERGVAQLARALETGTTDGRVVTNYANALAGRGRWADAVPLARAWAEAHPDVREGWNTLGWLLGVTGDDLEAGRLALEGAVRLDRWYGDARLNLGRLFVKQQRLPQALEQLTLAIQSKDCWRPHEAWTRLGEVHAARGHLRRALGALRRAQEVDRRGEYTQQTFQAVGALTHVLHQHRRFILHVFDETARSRAIESNTPVVSPDAPREPLSQLAARARALRPHVREDAHTALDAVEELAGARELLPRWTDQSPCSDLENFGGEDGRALAASWRVAQADLYEELLEREEPQFDASTGLGTAQAAAAQRRWDDALAGLEPLLRDEPEAAGLFAERWGDRLVRLDDPATAARCYALAQDGLERFASWSTSGGEGTARMVAVTRVKAKRASLPEKS